MESQFSAGRCVYHRPSLAGDFVGLMPLNLHGGDVVSGETYSSDSCCAGRDGCGAYRIRGRFYRDGMVQRGTALGYYDPWSVGPPAGFDYLWGSELKSPYLPTPQLDTAGNGSLAPAHIAFAQFIFTMGPKLAGADVCPNLRNGLAGDGRFAIKNKRMLK